MADTRKHEPKDRDELDRALRHALEAAKPPDTATQTHAAQTQPQARPGTATLGSFTFLSKG